MLKNIFKSNWFYIVLLILLTLPLCSGFMGNRMIDGHDSEAALMRAVSMNKYMGHGQILVRWSPEVNLGYGYPMFNFYPPLFSFVAVFLFQFTHQMVLAINTACVLFWILSGIGMYLLAREYWGNEGGMLSALLYIYAPYHIMDMFIRGAFAEFSSFAFFPFLLLSLLKVSQKVTWQHFILGIMSVFGLSLAHNIMSMLFFPVAFIFMLYLYFFEKKGTWIFIALGIFIIGLMLSSFFWLPALLEKQFLNLNFLIGKHYDFHENFISLRKLFWPFKVWTMDHISFQVGVIHTLLGLGTLFLITRIFKINHQSGKGYLFFLTMALLAIFFTLPYSHLFWEHLKLLDFVQFPWRFLTIIVFAVSFLGGSAVLLWANPLGQRIFLLISSVVCIIFYLKTAPDISYISQNQEIQNFIALGEGEYTPKWVSLPPQARPEQKFQLLQGRGQLAKDIAINPVHYQTEFKGLEPSLICFHAFYFPGWQVKIDGQSIKPYMDNPFGVVLFPVPAGDHDIQVFFGSTPIRTAGVLISWVGIFLLISMTLWIKFSKGVN